MSHFQSWGARGFWQGAVSGWSRRPMVVNWETRLWVAVSGTSKRGRDKNKQAYETKRWRACVRGPEDGLDDSAVNDPACLE